MFSGTEYDVQPAGVAYYVDNVLAGVSGISPFSWVWDSSKWADGTHTLKAVAFDDAGNSNWSEVGVNVMEEREMTYDFRTGAGTDKWAFRGETPATLSVTEPHIEFTTAQYERINKSDNVRQEDQTSTEGYYAAHRFNFSIKEATANINRINVTWEGIGDHDSATDGAKLYIYNFDSGAYEELDSTTCVTEQTLTGEKTASISSYINSGNVTVLVNQTSADAGEESHSHIWTDYVKLVITTI